jgi:hypothetical protein
VLRAVAAKLVLLRHVTPGDYAERIHRQAEPLDELEGSGFSVRGRLARLHTGLSPLQRAAFRCLGTLPGPECGEADLLDAFGGLFGSPSRAVEALLDVHLLTLDEAEPAEEFEVMAHAAPDVRYRVPRTALRFAALLRAEAQSP